ncbi:ribosome maturation factor RimM, partial [Enterococcus faecium]|uniref:ribosome maturation factor RimM n=1 Tax=Enterococcus faecium TaxID=1352 RepID=UPI003CC50C3E
NRDGILKVSKDNSVDLAENEFYYHEFIGLHVLEDGTELGKVKEILSPGANVVWVVQRPKKADILLPFIASVVKEVDLEAGVVRVDI